MERNLFKYSVPLASKGLLAAPPLMDLIEGSTLAGALMDAIREPLLVLDGDLHVVTANRSFYLEFKLERQDVQDRSVYALGDGQWNIPELRLLLENVAPQHAVMDACEVEQDFSGIGRRTMTINARKLFCADTLRPAILLLIEDTTERRARECEMKALLQEKDVLLQEMQHRIANSLQIIASILLIKARTVRSEETRLHLQDAHQRVMSIAAMQQQLQVSEPGTTIELGPYLSRLCETLAASMIGDRRPISLKVHARGGAKSSGQAVSIGLIVTELVINAFKHAFPDNRNDGTVTVAYDLDDANWRLTVSDNGVGRSAGQPYRSKSGLGTTIVEALAKRLDAEVDVAMNPHGTTVSIIHAPFASRLSAVAFKAVHMP
jgi:two-component sensor histidine kinase